MNNLSAEVSVKFPGNLQFPKDGCKNNISYAITIILSLTLKVRGFFVCFFSFGVLLGGVGLGFLVFGFFWCMWISLLVADCFRSQRGLSYFVLDEFLGSFFSLKDNYD